MPEIGPSSAQAFGPTDTQHPTESRQQRALMTASALQTAILQSTSFSSIATDARGVIQLFNAGAERMLGYAAADVVNLLTPADLSDPQELILRAHELSNEFGIRIAPGFAALVFKAREGIEDIYELTYLKRDGTRLPAVVSVTALRDASEQPIGYLLIGTDNTVRKEADAEQRRLDQVLSHAHAELVDAKVAAETANQAKSKFLSNMSHELRSPLNAILGFAQLLEHGTPPPTPAQKDSIEQILHAGWYLLELINEILDLALIESGKLSISLEPMALAEVLADCQAMVDPQASSGGIRIGFVQAMEPLFVKADRTRVKQVLINLLSNAIKYNSVGGSVEVSTHVRSGDTRGAGPHDRVRISVRDTGPGLSADKMSQLFQPFNRLGQEGGGEEGTGIGLVVSKRLVELMGGEIGAHSEPGVGSEFWVDLPNCAAPGAAKHLPQPDAIDSPSPVQPGAARHTVLYVEDNPANLMLVTRLLERRPDIRLLSARDGRSGVELARSAQPTVILMDINLPGISGVTALRMLASDASTAHIPVVALSANAMPHDIEKGLAAGFFRYLTKPIKQSSSSTRWSRRWSSPRPIPPHPSPPATRHEHRMNIPTDILAARILIVDDQAPNVQLLTRLLEESGYTQVSSTMNPMEVCALHRKNDYGLILLDLQMPGMDGFAVMDGLKTNPHDTYLPVIVLTAQPGHKLRALQAGAKDFISKPFDLLEVKTRIYNMLEVRLLYRALEDQNARLEEAVAARTAELRESEARFRSLTELASDWYWEQDDTGAFTKVSGPVMEMLGIRVAPLEGPQPTDLAGLQGDGWDAAERAFLQSLIDNRQPFLDYLFHRVRADGSMQQFRVSGQPMFDHTCRFVGYRGIGVEVTAGH